MHMNGMKAKTFLTTPLLWAAFFLYLIIAGYTAAHHELWGDEIHSWNIAKGSKNFFELILNTRYEGHPPLWYTILWFVSKLTHNPSSIQLVHFFIASLVVFLLLFYSPLPLSNRVLLPFGYFFLFEYTVLSRNYSIGLLLAFCICLLLNKNLRHKHLLYYSLLFLLSNTHLLAALMAVSLHIYFLMLIREEKKKMAILALHTFIGITVLLPSIYFIFPPPDSSLGVQFWLQRWNVNQLAVMVKAPVKAFIPVPAWWNYHFWNTQFLLEVKWSLMKWIIIVLSAGLMGLAITILKESKKSLFFFLSYVILIFMASTIIPFSNARQVGFMYAGFLVAYWLYSHNSFVSCMKERIISCMLVIQLIGGLFAVSKEIKLPFSNGYLVNKFVKEIPVNNKMVTDYWCLNTLSAFMDTSFYCVDLQKEASYLLWNQEVGAMTKASNRYSQGFKYLFEKERIYQVYMISINSPQRISKLDSQLFKLYKVNLIDKKEDAIERSSNLYLYHISVY